MLDLNTLKQALAPLAELGRDEMTFEAAGMQITIRPLLPLDEVAVQRFSSSILDDIQSREGLTTDDNMSRAAAMDYFDRFRIEIIAYSIVQVDNYDLRDVKHIATGETLPNGVAVKVPKHIAMREIVQGWSRAMLTICFARYADLVQKVADNADKIAQTSLPDLDAEIQRVEERLAELKETRETRAKGDPSITHQQIMNLVDATNALDREKQEADARARAEVLLAKERAAMKGVAAGRSMTDVEQPEAGQPEPEPEPAPVRQPVIPPSSPPPTTFGPGKGTPVAGGVVSSFGDGDDPEVVAAEEQRILEARRLAAVAAQKAAAQDPIDPLRGAEPAGHVDGVAAYRLPTAEMSPRGRQPEAREGATVNPEISGTKNPNFKPSR